MMKEVVIQHTDESGNCTLSQREVFEQVVGPGTKGRERMMGKTVGKKKGTETITKEDMARVIEDIRRENAETVARAVEAIRLENVANMQSAIQAMIASGQLMVIIPHPLNLFIPYTRFIYLFIYNYCILFIPLYHISS
jgi:hypothetical protein